MGGIWESPNTHQSKVAENTNGALNTKQNKTRFTMCVYWYGIGVVTILSQVLYAACDE